MSDPTPRGDGGSADPVVDAVFDAVAATAPEIRAALPGRRVESGTENASGESVLAGDLYADELLGDAITAVDGVGSFVSEERESAVDAGGAVGSGPDDAYAVAIDPLDGSSNLRSNNAMGTVVGIYDAPLPASGRDLVAAGYVLYGPITTMVVADETGVREEVVERTSDGDGVERSVVEADLTLPETPTVYGFGGRVPDWTAEFRAYARAIEDSLKLRYGGAMVGDVNQVLTYGGVFAYPALRSAPEGKLRLQFEANPIAYVIERAGGASSDGTGSILDVEPEAVHQRTPLYVGNEALIERLEAAVDAD
ncbi:fructose-1,6-bisphosphatase [Halorubrum sp. SP3]|uniref:class 1 fructose-bisphosphatase n=1 Tax=unclassified Halorubrum TaxID=2642239 RepID=UPI0010F932A7|nr:MULTISPECIES: class 1 fructose-bisphosphatase [unclassified Halorubrum]TKX53116.1 fructose-1,6-bisphosphatase [Halorubrum sp. SP3]TKX67577.1 fructose-1,6-bisphosphatase [Halorubrum sp. SP9]